MRSTMYTHEDAHRYRIALEQIISTLGPTVPMCGCMARCKSCRGGLHIEAVDVLTLARDAIGTKQEWSPPPPPETGPLDAGRVAPQDRDSAERDKGSTPAHVHSWHDFPMIVKRCACGTIQCSMTVWEEADHA